MAFLSDPCTASKPIARVCRAACANCFLEALTAELRGGGDPGALYPEEARHLQKAVRKRLEEFAAGRLCARLLLREFGIDHFAVEVGADRQPLWPEKLVGSITHTTGFCAVVAAPKNPCAPWESTVRSAVRQNGTLARNLHGLRNDLAAFFAGVRARSAATVIFSAKEAFYKCQFAVTQERLSFHDVSIELPAGGERRGVFKIIANRRIELERQAASPLQGGYLFHEQFVTAEWPWR